MRKRSNVNDFRYNLYRAQFDLTAQQAKDERYLLFNMFTRDIVSVLVNGHRCPIIGNICMDACMIDVTDIDAREGDTVIIFGDDLPVSEMADRLKTIPYEILTSISPRVKRIYYSE